MAGEYKKFTVEMNRECSRYRLWKKGIDGAACVIETYKNKRSVYFAVSNVLPSQTLMREQNKEYHLLLVGVDEGELIQKDFGAFYVNHRGEGSIFKKFSGPEISCYTHCLFVTAEKDSEKTETLFRGLMPFFTPAQTAKPKEEGGFTDKWAKAFEKFFSDSQWEIFAEGADETQAQWCKVSQSSPLPEPLKQCRDLITSYGHYIIGKKNQRCFVGVPGRFLQKEQPCRQKGCFTLWQPIRGGEKFFAELSDMTETLQEEIFGYWIGEIDGEDGEIIPL